MGGIGFLLFLLLRFFVVIQEERRKEKKNENEADYTSDFRGESQGTESSTKSDTSQGFDLLIEKKSLARDSARQFLYLKLFFSYPVSPQNLKGNRNAVFTGNRGGSLSLS